ncbi:MAG: erythronate-4-phosphate dehydrogenase [Flavobacteriales bacterium]|jgi:erythronate-4-phosphate dehydrogenase
MKIIVDENIPYANELFGIFGEVVALPGRDLKHDDVKDARALVVRSVSKVNESLLNNSKVEFVGTCTIGTDHLDKSYLEAHKIRYSSAPGCNANAVVQYIFSVLARLDRLDSAQRVGIIGCGNVGGRLHKQLKKLGFSCVCIDPNLDFSVNEDLAEFSELYDCDIICMHTPLVLGGDFPSVSLVGVEQFKQFKPGCLLINAGRGECVDNPQLKHYLKNNDDLDVVLDVWTAEPNMDGALFEYLKYGSPHIAGYSFEGKINGSTMIFRSLAQHLGLADDEVDQHIHSVEKACFGEIETLNENSVAEYILAAYDVDVDSNSLHSALNNLPASFDLLRKQYRKRREFSHYRIGKVLSDKDTEILLNLGFNG